MLSSLERSTVFHRFAFWNFNQHTLLITGQQSVRLTAVQQQYYCDYNNCLSARCCHQRRRVHGGGRDRQTTSCSASGFLSARPGAHSPLRTTMQDYSARTEGCGKRRSSQPPYTLQLQDTTMQRIQVPLAKIFRGVIIHGTHGHFGLQITWRSSRVIRVTSHPFPAVNDFVLRSGNTRCVCVRPHLF